MGKQPTSGWVVMKFGGTSVSSAANWDTICAQAGAAVAAGRHVLVVVSALSGVTNQLQRLAEAAAGEQRAILDQIEKPHQRLLGELELRIDAPFREAWQSLLASVQAPEDAGTDVRLAAIQSHGELLSSTIGAQVLARTGHPVQLHPAISILRATDRPGSHVLAAHCEAEPDAELRARLADQGLLHITQGFLAGGPDGRTWLLGRGGSDTSAALLAARLGARELQIWTDVPGMFSADPRIVADARLLRHLSYGEAQEFASMGARVLHPPCIDPVRRRRIPLTIRDTGRPDADHTEVGPRSATTEGLVKGIVARHDITLVHLETPAMWQQAGFLADAFAVFKRHGISIDLISTSESGVTVSLDPARRGSSMEQALERCLQELAGLCRVELRRGCVSISLIGNAIRAILSRLSEALTLFQDRSIHMVTQSSNDLNLTLVIDAEQAERLVQKLHRKLISPVADHRPEFGPSWTAITLPADAPPPTWWERRRKELQACLGDYDAVFAYDLDTVREAARRLLGLRSFSRVLYAVKANNHPEILRALAREGVGFECVSPGEIQHVLDTVPGLAPETVLFTPNFAARSDYAAGLEAGVRLTIDNLHPLSHWPELFRGREVFLRLDLDTGYGHHSKVITMGSASKFGIPLVQLDEVCDILAAEDIRVTGLHAHTGSGVGEPEVWQLQLQRFLDVLPRFPDVRVIDLGGGLSVPERRDQAPFDLARLDDLLAQEAGASNVDLWLEPGRYLVAEAGVLLARVTQVKRKSERQYLGIGTGMNSLIRPALYGAYHDIFNLTRLGRPSTQRYTLVGPICETGDVLGESRFLPRSSEGDVILVANAGAYGRVMSSNYNLRAPATEVVLSDAAGSGPV